MSEPSIAREMHPNRHSLDEDTASRLLQGLVHADDAPPGYAAVAGLLNSAAQLPLGPVDEDAAATTVSAMVEVIRDVTPAPEISRRKTMLGKLLAGKALAAVAVVGLTATGAAAATGSLPDPAQAVVSDAVGHVGVNIPHPSHGKSAAHRQDGKDKPSGDDDAPAGDDQGQPGDNSEPNNGQQTSTDAHNARDAAKEAGEKVGPAVCAAVTDNKCQAGQHGQGSDSDDQGTPPTENPGQGQSGEHGKPEVTPPAPPNGGIETGAENGERDLPSGKGKPE